ncbi:MAG: SUMF1/EgtB/PvdO family nonheme iron enzyme [Planctomycetota bacterium]|jgi:formylglycine-generating enzyme required for sulfatase activity
MDFDKLAGSDFAGLTVERLISKSASGASYIAHQEGRQFLLKVLPPRVVETRNDAITRFLRELGAIEPVEHENIVRVLGMGENLNLQFVVFEFFKGPTLAQVIRERAPLPLDEAISILRELFEGCAAAHEAGVLHWDLQPLKIFLTEDLTPKITGFGISKKLLHDGGVSLPGQDTESVVYMSPEQVAASEIDARTNLYALGLIGFEMLVGRPPFSHESLMALRMMHSIDPPPDPCSENPEIPAPIGAFLLKLLAKEPNARFPDAPSALKALEIAMMAGEAPAAAPPEAEGFTDEAFPPAFSDEELAEKPLPDAAEEEEPEVEEQAAPAKPTRPRRETAGISAMMDDVFSDFDGFFKGDEEAPEAEGAEEEEPPAEESGSGGDRQRVEANLADAEEALSRGDFEGALGKLHEAEALDPKEIRVRKLLLKAEDAHAAYLRITAAFRRMRGEADTVEMEKMAKEILALKPDDEEAQQYLRDLEEMQTAPVDNEEVDRHVLRVHQLLQRGDIQSASQRLRAAEAIAGGREDVTALRDQIQQKLEEVEGLRTSAEEAYQAGDLKTALDYFQDLRDYMADPTEIDARIEEIQASFVDLDAILYEARKAWQEKRAEDAEHYIAQILEHEPEHYKAFQLKSEITEYYHKIEDTRGRAQDALDHGHYQMAKDLFVEVTRLQPDDSDAEARLGEIELIFRRGQRGGKTKYVLIALVGALIVAGGVLGGLYYRKANALKKAENLIAHKDLDKAKKILKGLGDFLVDTAKRDALMAQIASLEKKKTPDSGQGQPLPPNWKKPIDEAAAKIEALDWEGAETAIQLARDHAAPPEKVQVLLDRMALLKIVETGKAADAAGKWRDAKARFDEAAKLGFEDSDPLIEALFQKQLLAAKDMKDSDPIGYVNIIKELGVAFGREKELQGLLESSKIDPRISAAKKAREQEKWKETITLLREAAGNPAVAKTAVQLIDEVEREMKEKGDTALRAKDYARAVVLFEALKGLFYSEEIVEKLDVAKYENLLARGEGFISEGKITEAVNVFTEANDIALDERAARWLEKTKVHMLRDKAKTLEEAGKLKAAKATLEEILDLQPGDVTAQRRIERIQILLDYRENLSKMDEMFAQGRYFDALEAANNAVNSGIDDGTGLLAADYLKPLLTMNHVPAGTFTLGADDGREREKPSREVDVPEFYVSPNEITVKEYAAFLKTTAGAAHEPLDWEAQQDNPNHPVVGISLEDAKAYAASLRCEIPTEEEWEKAARGTDGRPWPWGKEFKKGLSNTYEAKKRGPAAVTAFQRDKSPFKCFNMAGNVAEWTASPYAAYPGGEGKFPEGMVVIRGGDFSFGRKYARCFSRRGIKPEAKKPFVGFRIVRRITVQSLRDLK